MVLFLFGLEFGSVWCGVAGWFSWCFMVSDVLCVFNAFWFRAFSGPFLTQGMDFVGFGFEVVSMVVLFRPRFLCFF